MSNLPLKALMWDWADDKNKDTNAICRAKSPSHEYIVRMSAGGEVYVDYYKFDNSEGENNRKDEPPVFDSVSAAQEWAQSTHYPHKMQPYVKPSPTWISVDKQLPEDKEKYLVFTECGKVWTGHYGLVTKKPNEWYLHGYTVKQGWHPYTVVGWMPIPEFSKQGE